MPSNDIGDWEIVVADNDAGGPCLVLNFSHVGDNGVESFSTAMLPTDAFAFGLAVLHEVYHVQVGDECDDSA